MQVVAHALKSTEASECEIPAVLSSLHALHWACYLGDVGVVKQLLFNYKLDSLARVSSLRSCLRENFLALPRQHACLQHGYSAPTLLRVRPVS